MEMMNTLHRQAIVWSPYMGDTVGHASKKTKGSVKGSGQEEEESGQETAELPKGV